MDEDEDYSTLIAPGDAFVLLKTDDISYLELATNLDDEIVIDLLEEALNCLYLKQQESEKKAEIETQNILTKIKKDLH